MENIQIFILVLVIPQCVVDGVSNSTKTNAHQHITHSTVTSQTGHTDHPYTVSPAGLQTTHTITIAGENAGNDLTKKPYNEMSSKEFTSWFTDMKATFTNQVERIPKTEPFKKATINPKVGHIKTTIGEVLFGNNDAVETRSKNLLKTDDETTHAGHKTKTDDLSTHQTTEPNTLDRIILHTNGGLTHGPETDRFLSETENLHTTTDTVTINRTYNEATWQDFKTDEQHRSLQTSTEMTINTTLIKDQAESTEPVVLVRNTTTGNVKKGSDSSEEKTELESQRRTRLFEVIKRINESNLFDSSQLEGFDWDKISTGELATILSSLRTLKDSTKDIGNTLSTENLSNVEVISMDKLVVVVSTISAALILFIVIMCIIYCRKGKPDNEPQNESMKSDILQLRKTSISSEVSNGKVNSDTFMGIPPNNDIWRELQALPATESTVVSDNKGLEIAKF